MKRRYPPTSLPDTMSDMNNTNIASEMLLEYSEIINKEIEKRYAFVKTAHPTVKKLYEAQKYSITAGGKRIRPALALISEEVAPCNM